MSEQPDLREWTRINHALEVMVELDLGGTIAGRSRNISANGVLIDNVSDAKVGAAGAIMLTRREGESTLTIRGRGEVVRSDSGGTAVRLSSLTGEESYAAMRNLIVYNAADEASQAEKEFREHIGLKRPQA